MPPQDLGFAVVGTGMIAAYHARAIAKTRGARLVGVVSRSAERGLAFAAEHGASVVTATAEEMAQRPDVQALAIATPSGAHLEPALAGIQAGRHVLIEKPLEITPERVDRILDAAEAAGVKVGAIFQSRFGPGAQAVKAAVDAGRLGRMVLASAYVKWNRSAEYYRSPWKGTWALDGGAALINQAIHGLDLLQWFAGLPTEVSGRFTRRVHTGIEADDTTVATLQFPDGALGVIEASTALWPGWSRRIELCGEAGSIRLEDDRITQWEFATPQPQDDAIRASAGESQGSGAADPGGISIAGHLAQLEDFVAAIRDDRPPAIDGREGRKAVALVHAIYESAKSGRPRAV
jgi:UDP-N-acetyl-2-amino-2-deoxyglucuronate dehydrogenase